LTQSLFARLWGIVVILGKPQSRGALWLRSRSASEPVHIDPGYFSDRRDMDTMIEGVALARRVAAAPAFVRWGNRELMPGPGAVSRKALERFVRKNVITTFHYAGTCRMGTDDAAVVDL